MNDQPKRVNGGRWRDVCERYERDLNEQRAAIRTTGRRWNQLSYVRGGSFLVALALVFSAFQDIASQATLWWVLAAIVAIFFLVIIAVHDRLERELERLKHRADQFAESLARCKRDWKGMAVATLGPSPNFRPVALDLDVFGQASLAQLFSSVRTAVGLPLLAEWLMTPAVPNEIRDRQSAVDDLGQNTPWREQFQLDCRMASASPVGSERFLGWVGSPGWLVRLPILHWAARISAALVAFFAISFFAGWVAPQVAGVALLLLLALNFLVTVFVSGKVHEIFEHVSSRKNEVQRYVTLFQQLKELKTDSPRLANLQKELLHGPLSAIQGMSSLARIVWLGNMRRHGFLFVIYLFLQFAGLWDLHTLFWLERWQQRYRQRVPGWFAALAQAEVLAAMATMSYENPDWVFPHVEFDDPATIETEQLGHPLLPNDARVTNDVSLGPPGTVLIITGSNMSGKSTMLRSIGLNVILAQMGSVVCAQRMRLHPVVLETSMRIDDSLADGVSFFMAELKRLKQIVDRSLEVRAGNGQFLFLLDEILQGTNSRERHIAVEAVIRKLLSNGAFGSFTTHDLDLARDRGLGQMARTVYFTEHFEKTHHGDQMKFDFVMRDGIAPTTNALKLLRIVGLGEVEG